MRNRGRLQLINRYSVFPVCPKTILEWREEPESEPAVDRRAIERYVERILKDPTDVAIEIFILIEENRTWFEEYKKILERNRQSMLSDPPAQNNSL